MTTTTNLRPTTTPRRHWFDLETPVAACILIACLIGIAFLSARIRSEQPAVTLSPTPALILVFPTAVPTAAPVQPTTDPAVYVELEALRARVAELEQAVPPAPQVIYQTVYEPAAPVYVELAAPTPEPEQYQVANEPNSIDARQALIGTDPNALACQNAEGVASPLCGGITNAEAQAALDRERNIQNRLVEQPTSEGHAIYAEPNEVQRASLAEAWRLEHCINIDTAEEVCQ